MYRPEIIPEVRAMKLTEILVKMSRMLQMVTISDPGNNHPPSLAFWLANISEFLNFLISDKHVHSYAVEAQVC